MIITSDSCQIIMDDRYIKYCVWSLGKNGNAKRYRTVYTDHNVYHIPLYYNAIIMLESANSKFDYFR